MAHFAQLDENNIVTQVIVVNNNELLDNDVESEAKGIAFCQSLFGGTWIQTSYNTYRGVHEKNGTPLRWTFAGVGHTYRADLDAFIAPSAYVGWVFDETIMDWVAPVPKPDSGLWVWDNETVSWKEYEVE